MKDYTRRGSLALGLGMAVTACGGGGGDNAGSPVGAAPVPTPSPTPAPAPTPTPTATPTGLARIAAAKGMRFGSTFAYAAPGADAGSFNNPAYAALLERDCSVLVPENELKWAAVRPSATTFDFGRADAMLAYAESKGLAMRGHNLLWYNGQYDPTWLAGYDFGADRRAGALALLRTHVDTVVRRYGTRIMSWDVINEVIDPATGRYRTNTLSNAVGNDNSLIDLAFATARAANPGAQLVYNDYMDWGLSSLHRDGVLALLRGFRDRGVPVDALGVQSHIDFGSTQPVADILAARVPRMRAFLDQVVAMDYALLVTELDVNDSARTGDLATRDADVAALGRGWLDLLTGYPQLKDVLVWGMCDKYSWLQSASFNKRADGLPVRPDPYDAAFTAKPLQAHIAAAFAATTARG